MVRLWFHISHRTLYSHTRVNDIYHTTSWAAYGPPIRKRIYDICTHNSWFRIYPNICQHSQISCDTSREHETRHNHIHLLSYCGLILPAILNRKTQSNNTHTHTYIMKRRYRKNPVNKNDTLITLITSSIL